jgi:hypothetical protein
MDELLAQSATGPSAGEQRLVAVELFLADLAEPRLNPQQHRLPGPGGFSNAHASKYSEAFVGKTRSWSGQVPFLLAERAR